MKKINLTQSDLELIRLRDTMRPELERGMSAGGQIDNKEQEREKECRKRWRQLEGKGYRRKKR